MTDGDDADDSGTENTVHGLRHDESPEEVHKHGDENIRHHHGNHTHDEK